MGADFFQFKRFTIHQQHCAQKVGTLACLLGALCQHDAPEKILDIGTGTGLLALMLAQRYADAQIQAIEIEEATCKQAKENFTSSLWAARLQAIHDDLRKFTPTHPFDIIISNPPFFTAHMPASHQKTNMARHDATLRKEDILIFAKKWLHQNGLLWILLPPRESEEIEKMAPRFDLQLYRRYQIYIRKDLPLKACITCFGRNLKKPVFQDIVVHENHTIYTSEFIDLLQDYYLHL